MYFVHFLGWKSRYDREVSEDFLLEDTQFTRKLKEKIDEIITNVNDKAERIKRIDTVLQHAAMAPEDVDWETLPGTWQNVGQTARTSTAIAPAVEQLPPSSDSYEEPEERDADAIAHSKFENLEAHLQFAPNVKLPDSLFSILEGHCRSHEIAQGSQTRRATPTPSWCSVLYLLQIYVNGFPYCMNANKPTGLNRTDINLFPPAVHRERFSKKAAGAYAKTDRSRRICAEFCSSVRILFDALLVEYLLYPNEDRKRAPFGKEGQVIPQGDPFTIIPLEEIQRNPSYPCLIYESVYILRLIGELGLCYTLPPLLLPPLLLLLLLLLLLSPLLPHLPLLICVAR
ncbi:unnamed protein product [Mesocestoides corti]|uniref:Uncharacterized protein n=1 Tax=Mesocestoides corti TaxID=53468 RepID=A0A0R3UP75_MESCO|nr:unnamed protein product [Mesocestoides corti]